jgi:hypothetical protein
MAILITPLASLINRLHAGSYDREIEVDGCRRRAGNGHHQASTQLIETLEFRPLRLAKTEKYATGNRPSAARSRWGAFAPVFAKA